MQPYPGRTDARRPKRGRHERYLSIFKLIQDRDKQIALAFDGLSRSNALFKLTEMRRENLLTDQEFAEFSDETQRIVSRML